MEREEIDLLVVEATEESNVEAIHADVELTIRSATLVRRKHELGRAREIVQLLQDLTNVGIDLSQVEIKSVYAESGNTVFKGSHARYHLLIHCPNLDKLPDVLTAIAKQKQGSIDRIVWQYGDETSLHDQLLEKALQRANSIARLSAATLGTRIVGVHRISEQLHDDEQRPYGAPMLSRSLGMKSSFARAESSELETIPVLHTRTVKVTVNIEYRINGWRDPERRQASDD